jgi:hypothetical protein
MRYHQAVYYSILKRKGVGGTKRGGMVWNGKVGVVGGWWCRPGAGGRVGDGTVRWRKFGLERRWLVTGT